MQHEDTRDEIYVCTVLGQGQLHVAAVHRGPHLVRDAEPRPGDQLLPHLLLEHWCCGSKSSLCEECFKSCPPQWLACCQEGHMYSREGLLPSGSRRDSMFAFLDGIIACLMWCACDCVAGGRAADRGDPECDGAGAAALRRGPRAAEEEDKCQRRQRRPAAPAARRRQRRQLGTPSLSVNDSTTLSSECTTAS